jgi:ribosomal protein S18 acetylase RimI-like enzyme
MLKLVGERYGWDRRPKYLDYADMSQRLNRADTRFYDIQKDGQPIGYILATNPKVQDTIEIENFGLFPGYTGYDYGDTALQLTLDELLEDYPNVYLTSRSTNHPKVIPFYESHGMQVVAQEVLEDDLVPAPQDRNFKVA